MLCFCRSFKIFEFLRARSQMSWKHPGKVRAQTYGTKSPSRSEALRFINSAKSQSTNLADIFEHFYPFEFFESCRCFLNFSIFPVFFFFNYAFFHDIYGFMGFMIYMVSVFSSPVPTSCLSSLLHPFFHPLFTRQLVLLPIFAGRSCTSHHPLSFLAHPDHTSIQGFAFLCLRIAWNSYYFLI